LQTFVNPNPGAEPPSTKFYPRPAVAAVGKNLVLGFPFDDTFGTDVGIAYLFDARTGKVLRTFKSPNPVEGGRFGCAVAAVEDRLLVGAYHENTPDKSVRAGAAHVFDATTGELLHTLRKPAPADGDKFGLYVGVLGENFLVSCICDDTGAKDAGAVFLYDSATGELLWAFRSPLPRVDDYFGSAIAGVGNNLLVGVNRDDTKGPNAGAAYLFDGATGKVLQTFHNPVPDRKNGFGFAVAALEGNVLICDKNLNPPRADGGVVYLFDSVTGDVLRTFNNPAPAVNDAFGTSIAVVDGNVVVSAAHANANGLYVGAAYLFDGSTGEHLHTFMNPTPAWEDLFGVKVVGLGEDLLIVAPFDDTAGTNAGAVYLFGGGSSSEFAAGKPSVTLLGTPTTRLYVHTAPPGATVFLDKRRIGTSNGLFFVPPGDHEITLELPGHKTQTLPVNVTEGQITHLRAQLNRKPR
jgi:outer membrane protein assembly factor BamB